MAAKVTSRVAAKATANRAGKSPARTPARSPAKKSAAPRTAPPDGGASRPAARAVDRLAELATAVFGVSSPFACGGSVVARKPPRIVLEDGRQLTVEPAADTYLQPTANEALIRACRPAKFGKGRRTLYDRTIREAGQLLARDAFRVLDFDPEKAGILDEVRRALAPEATAPLVAELYALNHYGEGGHFRPHKDTPRGSDMLGTLVVCLPSHFSGGHLVVLHHGARAAFAWGDEIREDPDPKRLRWAAFFGDVDHAIDRLWSGSRITLSYILRRGDGGTLSSSPPDETLFAVRLGEALADAKFLPSGGRLAVPCFHMYSQDVRWQERISPIGEAELDSLKGRDRAVARAALDRGLEVSLHPYLVESCADETWSLSRFPTVKERAPFEPRMDPWKLEDQLPLEGEGRTEPDGRVRWLVPPPSFNGAPHLYLRREGRGAEPLVEGLPALEYVDDCEYSSTGYFGNEGCETAFYMYAALHIVVPAAGARPRSAARASAR